MSHPPRAKEAHRAAESAYLFRHALLREGAYQLQLPGDRARLHALGLAAIEDLCGGRPPDPDVRDRIDMPPFRSHATDPFAPELAEHARLASPEAHRDVRKLYLYRSAVLARRGYRQEAAQQLWTQRAELGEGAARGADLIRAAGAAFEGGRSQLAEQQDREALALFRSAGTPELQARAHLTLAVHLTGLGRIAEAKESFEEALALAPVPAVEASARLGLCAIAGIEGRFADAEKEVRRGLQLYRDLGDRAQEGRALGTLAGLLHQSGRLEDSIPLRLETLAIFREKKLQRDEALALNNLGIDYQETGRFAEAEQFFTRALEILRRISNRREEAIVLGDFATLLHQTGRTDDALRSFEQALHVHREVGNLRKEGVVLGNLAMLLLDLGRAAEARPLFEEALAIHARIGHRRFEAFHGCELARCFVALGRLAKARALWNRNIAILEELRNRSEAEHLRRSMRKECERAGVAPLDEAP